MLEGYTRRSSRGVLGRKVHKKMEPNESSVPSSKIPTNGWCRGCPFGPGSSGRLISADTLIQANGRSFECLVDVGLIPMERDSSGLQAFANPAEARQAVRHGLDDPDAGPNVFKEDFHGFEYGGIPTTGNMELSHNIIDGNRVHTAVADKTDQATYGFEGLEGLEDVGSRSGFQGDYKRRRVSYAEEITTGETSKVIPKKAQVAEARKNVKNQQGQSWHEHLAMQNRGNTIVLDAAVCTLHKTHKLPYTNGMIFCVNCACW